MCDNEAERTDWLKSIREAQSAAGEKTAAGSSKAVAKGEFAVLVNELASMAGDKVTSEVLIGILKKFRHLFGMASSRYVRHVSYQNNKFHATHP